MKYNTTTILIYLLMAIAGAAHAATFECDPVTTAASNEPIQGVRYLWIVNGEEVGTTEQPTRDIGTPFGTTEVQVYAEYPVEIEDADGARTVWERSEEGTNVARVRRSFWDWLRRLFVR